jgi:hypothetical protein
LGRSPAMSRQTRIRRSRIRLPPLINHTHSFRRLRAITTRWICDVPS